MRPQHASLVSTFTHLALLLEYAAAAYSRRDGTSVEIIVTKPSDCEHKSRIGDTIQVHYNGTLMDGTQFDSSYNRGEPLEFIVGYGKVIQGWDEGLLDMCTGEERKLTIPPDKAYGSQAMGPIPPMSTIIFDTLLVSIEYAPFDEVQEEEVSKPDAPVEYEEENEDEESEEGLMEGEEPFGIQTAPAEPPVPQATKPPSPGEDQNAGTHPEPLAPGEEKEPLLEDFLMTHGPVSMPTALPDRPITGLENVNTAPAAVASQQPVPVPHRPSHDEPGAVDGECRLLGPFALIVQACLGVLAMSSLVFKRWQERPRRPFKIWFFDVSKQVVGTALLHVLNLLMSIISAQDFELAHKAQELSASFQNTVTKEVNPCSWYLINIAIDTTIGIPILIILLRILHHAFRLTPLARPPESIKSGHYGQPPRARWWVKQSFIYFIGLVLMKLCVFFIITLLPWVAHVGDWALRWTEGNATLQIAFVMFVFPLVMNALQYYIIDSFIKDPSSGHERLPTDDDSSSTTQGSYHSVEHRDSMDSDDSDPAKDRSRTALLDSTSTTERERASSARSNRVKDA